MFIISNTSPGIFALHLELWCPLVLGPTKCNGSLNDILDTMGSDILPPKSFVYFQEDASGSFGDIVLDTLGSEMISGSLKVRSQQLSFSTLCYRIHHFTFVSCQEAKRTLLHPWRTCFLTALRSGPMCKA
jgi:hypothetical protein